MITIVNKTQSSWLLLIASLSVGLNANTDDIKQQDFSYQARINTDDTKSIQLLQLPENVQAKLHHHNAQDMRVYNADGELLPSIIKYDSHELQPAVVQSMVFFPLKQKFANGQQSSGSEQQNIAIKLEVLMNSKKEQSHQATSEIAPKDPPAYIIENPQYNAEGKKNKQNQDNIYQLKIDLDLEFDGIASLMIETSSDLNNWQVLVADDSVSRMKYKEQQLNKNIINIRGQSQRYLKLSWLGSNYPVINNIEAVIGQRTLKPEFVWSENLILKVVNAENVAFNTYELLVSPSFHANKLRLVSKDTDQIVSGVLSSRKNSGKHYYPFADFKFYQVKTNDSLVSVLEKNFRRGHNEHWRVQFQYPMKINIEDVALQINRYPASLYFLKQGRAPYTLAFGQSSIRQLPSSISTLMKDVMKASDGNYGKAYLASIEENIPEKESLFNWQLILLWSALICGVLVMIWMARSLFKQMSTTD
jgi:hypothetical protein